MYACVNPRNQLRLWLTRSSPSLFLRKGISQAENSPSRPGWLSNEVQGSVCLYPSALELQVYIIMSTFDVGYGEWS